MRKALFRIAAIAAAVALFTGVALANQPTTPDWFPSGFNLDSNAYSLRFAGDDRYETAGVIGLIHTTANTDDSEDEGEGWPFSWINNGEPSETWGLAQCGGAFGELEIGGVGVAAGDTSADALAASPAKDLGSLPAGLSVGDPTDAVASLSDAFMLLTNSTREGATTLNPDLETAIATMQEETGLCIDFDVVIFGGPEAVPTAVYDDLDDLNGTGEVHVIGGVDRYETAAKVAIAVGNGIDDAPGDTYDQDELSELDHYPTAAKARDPDGLTAATTDSPNTLDNVVFLAEGVTGADALTIGPVAAANNVPVLLTPTDSLPSFTADALEDLDPDTIVVLGGTAAISASTASAAAAAAPGSEEVIRVGGADRWETSVLISEQFFGIYGENQSETTTEADAGEHFDNLAIGFGRSEGAGAAFVGWPDVLASAWFIDEYDDVSDSTPLRAAPDWEQNEDYTFIGDGFWDQEGPESENNTPLLVVQQAAVPASVDDYLESLWTDPAVEICNADPDNGEEDPSGCNDGGFGFLFGGTAAISAANQLTIAGHLSGDTYGTTDITPTQTAALVFFTELDFSAYVSGGTDDEAEGGPTTAYGSDPDFFGAKICWYRNALTGSERAETVDGDGDIDHTQVDYQNTGAIDSPFPPFQSRFTCESPDDDPGTADAFGVSLSGHETAVKALDFSTTSVTLQSDASETSEAGDAAADSSGPAELCTSAGPFTEQTNGNTGSCTYTFEDTDVDDFRFKTTTENNVEFDLVLTVNRKDPTGGSDGGTTGADTDRITATGTLTVNMAGTANDFTATVTLEGFWTAGLSPDEIFLSGMYSIGTGATAKLGGIHLTVSGSGTTEAALSDLLINGNA